MKFDLNTENINYVKITYNDKLGFAHCIKAAMKFLGEYELLLSIKSEENLQIDIPQEVEIGLACDTGLYKSKTTLKKIQREGAYILFSLQKPVEMNYQQNREYFRVKLQEDANILFEENEQLIKIPAITYDISANGVRIELDSQISFPPEVKIILFLPQRTVDLKAKYIRTDDEDKLLKASFQFIDIKQSDLDYISQICFQKQLEERRKNLI